MDLSDLVQDWGGFEQLVAKLHETGDVSVEHNATIIGRSGASRQIDVLVTHRQGLYEHKVIVECKYRNQAIERLHVDALVTTVREVGANKGVIFSTQGFQSGAISEAKHQGIELYKIREPTDEEWGLPGRHLDLWLHVIGKSVGNVAAQQGYVIGPPMEKPPSIGLNFGRDDTNGVSIIADGRDVKTFEQLITQLSQSCARDIFSPTRVQFEDGGFKGKIKFLVNANYEPKIPLKVLLPPHIIMVPKVTFQVGVEILQSRIQFDRAAGNLFVLAVEDCIRKQVTAAIRKDHQDVTILTPLQTSKSSDVEQPFINGSIARVWVKGFQEFSGFADLTPGVVVYSVEPHPVAVDTSPTI